MTILRIEHFVQPDFDRWKTTFDSDPLGRSESGVRGHKVTRAVDDPNFVMIDLEFDDATAAAAFLARLEQLWTKVDVMRDPHGRIFELSESEQY